MNCKHVEKHLEDYLAGQLDSVPEQLITDHLAGCPRCRDLLEKEKSVSAFLKQADNQIDKFSISNDLLKKLGDIDRKQNQDTNNLTAQGISTRVRWMIIATVVVGLIGIGLLIIPFESRLNQQHVGSMGGPGFIWIGEFPADEVDPFNLDSLELSIGISQENAIESDGNRVIHILDFEDSTESSTYIESDTREENL
ncbi:zf-HC2 domain-containing protein [bacterium]|nr:zf-HC2 domain-containing protein [bacterium]